MFLLLDISKQVMQKIMTSADIYAKFCCYGLDKYVVVGFRKVFWFLVYCKYFWTSFLIFVACAELAMFLTFHVGRGYGFARDTASSVTCRAIACAHVESKELALA